MTTQKTSFWLKSAPTRVPSYWDTLPWDAPLPLAAPKGFDLPALLATMSAGMWVRGHAGHVDMWLPAFANVFRTNAERRSMHFICKWPHYDGEPGVTHWILPRVQAKVTCAACLVVMDQLLATGSLVVKKPELQGQEHHWLLRNYLTVQAEYRRDSNLHRDPRVTAAYALAGVAYGNVRQLVGE